VETETSRRYDYGMVEEIQTQTDRAAAVRRWGKSQHVLPHGALARHPVLPTVLNAETLEAHRLPSPALGLHLATIGGLEP
jgi:hypothetical protein